MIKRIYISFSLLLIGALIYASLRQNVLFMIHVPSELLAKIKIDIDYHNCSVVTYFIIFCLPDALWYAALLILQSAFFEQNIVGKSIFIISVIFPFLYEVMQKADVISGTFDPMDIFTYLFTLLILFLCQRKQFYQFLY